MAVTWAPDYSSFIDAAKYPGAVWYEGNESTRPGWYPANEYGQPDIWRGSYEGHRGGDPGAIPALRAAGEWNLRDPNSNAWKFLGTMRNLGDPRTDPQALAFALMSSGGFDSGGQGVAHPTSPYWQGAIDKLVSEGLDPAMAQGLGQGYWNAEAAGTEDTSGGIFGDVLRTGTEMVTQTPLGAALTAYGLHSGGMFPGAESASAGGTAAGGLEGALGPATGTVLEPGLQASGAMVSPVGAAGAPVVSGLATGGGPFIPTTLGGGLARILSGALDTSGSASSGGTAAGTAAGTALSRILNNGGTAADWAEILGRAAPGLIGAYASGEQADAIRDISERARADRAPFLGAATGWLTDPDSYYAGPGMASMKGVLHGLSSKFGNPIDSPSALGIATEAGMRDWRDAILGFGNLGLAGEDTRANLDLRATGADANVWGGLGDAAGSVFAPPRSLEQLLKEMQRAMGGSSALSLV